MTPDVLALAVRGDERAVRALYDSYAPTVLAAVRRLADSEAQARDWEQEAWLAIIRSLAGFRGESQLGSWIHRVAINAALQARRRDAGRYEVDTDGDIPEPPPTRDESDTILSRVMLEDAIRRLSSSLREVLVLHDVEGFRHEEIAELLGITAGGSRTQLFKARARLRALLTGAREGARL